MSEDIKKELRVEDIVAKIKKYQKQWLEHVKGMDPECHQSFYWNIILDTFIFSLYVNLIICFVSNLQLSFHYVYWFSTTEVFSF